MFSHISGGFSFFFFIHLPSFCGRSSQTYLQTSTFLGHYERSQRLLEKLASKFFLALPFFIGKGRVTDCEESRPDQVIATYPICVQ